MDSFGTKKITDRITVSAVNIVQVITVLAGEFGIGVIEGESVTAHLEFSFASLALPVLVARAIVGEEAVLLLAGKLLSRNCVTKIINK